MSEAELSKLVGAEGYAYKADLVRYWKSKKLPGNPDKQTRVELKRGLLSRKHEEKNQSDENDEEGDDDEAGGDQDEEATRDGQDDEGDEGDEGDECDEDEEGEGNMEDADDVLESEVVERRDGRTFFRFSRDGWINLGTFSVPSGKLAANEGFKEATPQYDCHSGKWTAHVQVKGGRVMQLCVSSAAFSPKDKSSPGHTVLVDGGQAGCYDGGTYGKMKALPPGLPKKSKYGTTYDWDNYVSLCQPGFGNNCTDAMLYNHGVTVNTGYGDGGYGVTKFTDKDKLVTRMCLDFRSSGCCLM